MCNSAATFNYGKKHLGMIKSDFKKYTSLFYISILSVFLFCQITTVILENNLTNGSTFICTINVTSRVVLLKISQENGNE